jgi:beta-galactosidase
LLTYVEAGPKLDAMLHRRAPGIEYGGDYNPEQWPEPVWQEDARLMREAGVTLVTVGVFAWAHLEPAEGRYDFDWLDRVLDLLHAHGVAVDLATATASPPPWFPHTYPRSLPVDAHGHRLSYGSRQAYCPSSPEYRAAAVRLAGALAQRYADHPALALWHVGNEYGCHVSRCYCETSAEAFREWLGRRYKGDLDALNAAWGTAFWSQRYTDWAQVIPPRATPSFGNPTQALDFERFSSDELLDCFRAERDVLRRYTPDTPVTTNFMAGMFAQLDYWAWARELDVVSTDHYLLGEDPENHIHQAFANDLTRSLAGGRPWLLMEHSTSAVNWQPRNLAKTGGQLRRSALAHVARGSDSVMYFQWRQSVAGAEKFHSAMVPHAGTGTRVWREVTALGAELAALAEVAGSVVERPAAAILLDYASLWAARLPARPSVDMDELAAIRQWHSALWRAGITVDFVHPEADLSRYRLLLAPSLYLLSDAGVANLESYVDDGGALAVGPFSGVVDDSDHVRPGRLRALLGVWTEEYLPLPAGGTIELDDGSAGHIWSELVHLDGGVAEVRYAATPPRGYPDAPLAGAPAVVRGRAGSTWYLTTRLTGDDLDRWLAGVTDAAGVAPGIVHGALPSTVDSVRRVHDDGRAYHFLINHGADEVVVAASGTSLVDGAVHTGPVRVPGRGAVVLRETQWGSARVAEPPHIGGEARLGGGP